MIRKLFTLNKRTRKRNIEIAVTLPGYNTKGTAHAAITIDATITDDTLTVDLLVYGGGTQSPGVYRGTFSAADLGLAPNRRTAEYMSKAHEREG